MAKLSEVKWGIIGYGGAFNMGKLHGESINGCKGMRVTAVCDVDPARTAIAEQDFPGIKTYNNAKEMFKSNDIDCVVIILPHNLHYPVAMAALEAGKGVVLEKPMCITTQEATAMIELAKKKDVLLTVFHNRRHDGDYKAIREFIDKGMIGDVFRIEAFMGGYNHPGTWWRSIKEVSGGCFYDWGAHIIDWTLNLHHGHKIKNVTGFFHKRVWQDITNEDETQAIVRFDDGSVADITISSIAMAGKPRWRILGTKGAITDDWKGSFKAFINVDGYPAEMEVKYQDGTWQNWYPNLAAHLLESKDLEVKAEEARRVIMVIDYAERSSKEGKSIDTPFE
ncbi:MAG: Gfo/Idh/MocA family oxidoreductase [Armatimonadota bacterium]|nr:Gfo/Idh/MocA family oxidoreductase [bacterium]